MTRNINNDCCGGIINKISYSYNDLTIVPAVISEIVSRKECNVYDENGMLPLFTAPMMSVVGQKNFGIWGENKINAIAPRTIPYFDRKKHIMMGDWTALSLKEFNMLFGNDKKPFKSLGECVTTTYKVLIDLANGHMKAVYDSITKAKAIASNNGYKLIIMTGNIANPETYKWICKNCDVDYIRLSIGTGAGCFVDGTKIITDIGYKEIEKINIGDKVLTSDGTYHMVESKIRYKTSNNIVKINGEVSCTDNHKFYVINKKDKNIVNEYNLSEYAYWVEAKNLNMNKHLLIKRSI